MFIRIPKRTRTSTSLGVNSDLVLCSNHHRSDNNSGVAAEREDQRDQRVQMCVTAQGRVSCHCDQALTCLQTDVRGQSKHSTSVYIASGLSAGRWQMADGRWQMATNIINPAAG